MLDFMHRLGLFLRFLLARFLADGCPQSAAALTYTSLFAVVPVMTVTFAMLSAVPAFQGLGEQIQAFVFSHFVPASGANIQAYLLDFSSQARQLTWLGVLLLAVTAWLMLASIERTFNGIWRGSRRRRGLASFLLYWAILSLGPLLLGAAFAISTYLASLRWLTGSEALLDIRPVLGVLPLALSVAAFTLLYAAVPNRPVPLRHALYGGLCAAVLLELSKQGFALYVSLFPSYQLIYGAFATVPLFLLWVYLCWLIILFGAQLACHWQQVTQRPGQPSVPEVLLTLELLRLFYQRQQQGLGLGLAEARQQLPALSEEAWLQQLAQLQRLQLVCAAGNQRWVLCRDLAHYSLAQLLEQLAWPQLQLAQWPTSYPAPYYPRLLAALQGLQASQAQWLEGSLADWLALPSD